MNGKRPSMSTPRRLALQLIVLALVGIAFWIVWIGGGLMEEGRDMAAVGLMFVAAAVWQTALHVVSTLTGRKSSA